MPSLDKFLRVRSWLVTAKRLYLTHMWGVNIHPTATFSLTARFDLTNPRGLHLGAESYIAFEATILTHDMTRRFSCDTYIGRRCFIGGRSIVLPGVRIGDESIVGAGSVVSRDVPPNSIVAGNPARIIRTGIRTGPRGYILTNEEIIALSEAPAPEIEQARENRTAGISGVSA